MEGRDSNSNSTPGEDLSFSFTDWNKLMHLSRLYGYDSSVLEEEGAVSAEELAKLGAAVLESLADIPNHNASGGKTASQMSPFEWFSGPRKQKLVEFIGFCQETEIL